MVRKKVVNKLMSLAPMVTTASMTMDMDFEIEAIHPDGIIYAMPGMFLGASEGSSLPDDEIIELIMEGHFEITPWDEVDVETLTNFFEDIERN